MKVRATSEMQKKLIEELKTSECLDAEGRRTANAGALGSRCYRSAETLAKKYPEVLKLQKRPNTRVVWFYDLILLKPEALGLK